MYVILTVKLQAKKKHLEFKTLGVLYKENFVMKRTEDGLSVFRSIIQ